ncbi:MAG: sodium:solute symporter [Woeseiaceae bacterium]
MTALNLVVILTYFATLLFIGAYFSRRQKSAEDYFKGKGRVPWWAAGISIFGTMLSAITYMAIPAKVYSTNWSYFYYSMTIILIAPLVAGLFIPFYNKLNITSAYEYLERRFNLATRVLASFSFILFQLGRIAVVLFLPSIAISVVTGVDVLLCITVIGLISIAYTLAGGIEAVIWTDVLQVVVLMGGALLALIWMVAAIDGGFGEVMSIAKADDKFNLHNLDLDVTTPTLWVVILGGIAANIISFGTDQSVVQRYVTSTDLADSKRTFYFNVAAVIPTGLLFFMIGTGLYVFYKLNAQALAPDIASNDAIFPFFIVNELPNGISGLLVAGILSAAMSSLSSSINSSATAYVTDFHCRFKTGLSPEGQLRIARIAALVVGILGLLLGLWMAIADVKSMWDVFIGVIGLFTGGLAGLFLLGMLSSRANGKGAVVGLLFSAGTQLYVSRFTEIHSLMYAFTGLLACFVVGYVASFFWPAEPNRADGLTAAT